VKRGKPLGVGEKSRERGSTFSKPRSELKGSSGPKASKPMRRSQPKRDWTDARAKVEREGVCRVCGSEYELQAAHVIGRHCDELKIGADVLYVHPDSIVPLCWSCHAHYDRAGSPVLDLLPYLLPHEEERAVHDAGGIVAAYRRTTNDRTLGEAA
jgi:hypothetical protein